MARNGSKRKGFTPENATAGIDFTIEDLQTNSDQIEIENENQNQSQPKQNLESNEQEAEDTVEKNPSNNSNAEDAAGSTPVSPSPPLNEEYKKPGSTNGAQQTKLSLEGLLEEKQKKYDKKQENVWLPPETTRPLQAVSKLVGKTNGGKSKVVEMALQEFFENHPDIVEKALEIYGD